ncbi:MAG: UDP-N-acetylmuramate--L-alanine ligase [bacterium]
MFPKRVKRVHFVGIGGIGMSGIAEVLINLGYKVSGSDLRRSATTDRLAALGGRVHEGHTPDHVVGADVVVISSAVHEDNQEVAAARQLAIPVIPRAEMLAELMRLKFGIAVSGTHGKTSTTSLIATILAEGGLDPTVVIGGKLNSLGTNAILGQGPYMVVEADESDGSFLKLSPTIAVVTNIDPEHMEHYGTLERLEDAFLTFVNKTPFYGLVVACLEHPRVQAILPRVRKRYVTYGFSTQADFVARDLQHRGLVTQFEVLIRGQSVGRVTLQMPGDHNVLNALAAFAVADELELSVDTVSRALGQFQGVQRRFTVRGERDDVLVVDDYGHHPAEIVTTLAGARLSFPERRLIAVFQPHRYTRVRDLQHDFAKSFNDAHEVLVTDIYAAGETPLPGIGGECIARAIRRHGHKAVRYTGPIENTLKVLRSGVRAGDLVITLGAGNVWRVGAGLLEGGTGD